MTVPMSPALWVAVLTCADADLGRIFLSLHASLNSDVCVSLLAPAFCEGYKRLDADRQVSMDPRRDGLRQGLSANAGEKRPVSLAGRFGSLLRLMPKWC